MPSVRLAPGGGLNSNCAADGTSKLTELKPTENAGPLPLFLPKTCTRSGIEVCASIASRTWPTSARVSFGASTSSYALRPATEVVDEVLTFVVGSSALSARSAACCGVTPAGSWSASSLPALPAGTV